MSDDPFPTNLAHACSLFPSIAEVCRRIGINRQQFNKYLAGAVRPSRHNMRNICDFFGVTEAELLTEPGRFTDLISLRPAASHAAPLPDHLKVVDKLHHMSGELDRYTGWYFRYFYAFGYPGRITRSLAVIENRDGRHLWKNIETGKDPDLGRSTFASKYEGLAFHLGHRIQIIEYESLNASSITQLVLYPSYTPRPEYLHGVQTGGSMKRGRKPAASAVVLEYLGDRIDMRSALARCGMFPPDEISDWVRRLTENRIARDEWVFEIEDL